MAEVPKKVLLFDKILILRGNFRQHNGDRLNILRILHGSSYSFIIIFASFTVTIIKMAHSIFCTILKAFYAFC